MTLYNIDEENGYIPLGKINGVDFEKIPEGDVATPDERPEYGNSWKSLYVDPRTLWAYTGPAWLMSLAYLDPGNLESDLQSGAYTNYSILWILFLSTVMGGVLQVLSLRLGVVTGFNLAQTCRREYSNVVSKILWVMTELAIIGSDVQEVVGSAIAFQILFGWPLYVGCLVTACDTFTFLGLHYFGMRKLEAFIVVLILTMTITFFVNMGAVAPPAGEIFHGWFVPEIPDYAVTQAVGTLGAVIMPHNIYLHSALVQSRKVDRNNKRKVAEANKYNTIDASTSLSLFLF